MPKQRTTPRSTSWRLCTRPARDLQPRACESSSSSNMWPQAEMQLFQNEAPRADACRSLEALVIQTEARSAGDGIKPHAARLREMCVRGPGHGRCAREATVLQCWRWPTRRAITGTSANMLVADAGQGTAGVGGRSGRLCWTARQLAAAVPLKAKVCKCGLQCSEL
jgi:hypothetical protein